MITKKEFLSYERVRESGVTNMFAVKLVGQLSGLNREKINEIMEKYTELSEKYLEKV